ALALIELLPAPMSEKNVMGRLGSRRPNFGYLGAFYVSNPDLTFTALLPLSKCLRIACSFLDQIFWQVRDGQAREISLVLKISHTYKNPAYF
ncbi:MAG: hypothetical protein KKA73_11705, partial [Chloroflexi bacterium]|nr:hypothetical protein [Chloroflexota bacterium]MBU1748344.1 hypothetical protein [Chloroflexota bacterium]